MDPLTHLLTGACIARTGFNRRSAYATVVMTLAAEAPDLDTLWAIRGPIASFAHHRGWTHTLLGLPVDAAAVVGAVWLFDRWHTHRRARTPTRTTPSPSLGVNLLPVRWPLLYLFAPFNPRWYAGSFVFIVEPLMLLFLTAGLLAPSLFGLINAEVGARRQPFPGRAWATSALLAILLLWSLRGYERLHAEDLARAADYGNVEIRRAAVSPYPINPFRWHGVVETPDFFQLSTVDSLTGAVATSEQADLLYKPAETRATLAAKRSPLGRAYLDWSPFPLVTESSLPSAEGFTTVTFRDLRFMYDTLATAGRTDTPLTGEVLVDEAGDVVRMSMDGRAGR